ncbi:MAG: META domain-containing protein [Bradyrhizobium sp.]|nr:MAG: META domain-containing protein [Bradyrhizobium sp.]
MKTILLRALFALAAVGVVSVALADDKGPPKPLPPLQKNFPLDQTWQLRELNGKPVSADIDASLKIDSALRGSGFTGCNSWSATMYPIKDQHLAVGPYALTKKQCDKDTMAIESSFLTGLLGTPTWDLVNGELVIKGPRGEMILGRSL